jgi:hypothetical protein
MHAVWRVANPSAAMRERGVSDLGFPGGRVANPAACS